MTSVFSASPPRSDLVTWSDLTKVQNDLQNELNAKFLELQQQILQNNEDGTKKSVGAATPADAPNESDQVNTAKAMEDVLQEKVIHSGVYEFEDSTWDIAIFAFIHPLPRGVSIATLGMALLNIVMQLILCLLIMAEFTKRENWPEDATNWRHANGHWLKYADSVGKTLVNRVCTDDKSMTLSGTQLNIFGDANGYVEDQYIQNLSFGPLLCFLVLLLWFLSALWVEMSRCFLLLQALFQMDRAPHSSFTLVEDHFALKEISICRLILITLMTAVRLVIAGLLYDSGARWLASTPNIRDLVLNAAALTFILDIDNILCANLKPASMHCISKDIEPLVAKQNIIAEYRDKCVMKLPLAKRLGHTKKGALPWKCLMCLVSLFTVTSLVFKSYVSPNLEQLTNTVKALCKEPQNFVVDMHQPTGIVFFWNGATEQQTQQSDLMSQVVHNMVHHTVTNEAQTSPDFQSLQSSVALPLENFVERYGTCNDFQSFQWHLRAPLEKALGRKDLQSCEDLMPQDCMKPDAIIRFACPKTCGCATPSAGYYMLAGCPITHCQQLNRDAWRIFRSEDTDTLALKQSNEWSLYWDSYVQYMKATGNSDNAIVNISASDVHDRFMALGCRAISNISMDIQDVPTVLNHFCTTSNSKRSLQPFCPESCFCSEAQSSFCPTKETSASTLICGDIFVHHAFAIDCGHRLPFGHDPNGAYKCIPEGYNHKNLYRRTDSVGVLWEIRWETTNGLDWGAIVAGKKYGQEKKK
mmetsp:Transcript_150259/g.276138  ORF Transcript_150259/g.276138 Transcript_150259/m.276138 type:complete len:754 (+) Transcript_150259:75-2336(+)